MALRNYNRLLALIASWLKPEGKLFIHIFCHRQYAYPFGMEGADNWLGCYFFSGGLMPADDLLLSLQDRMVLEEQWRLNGGPYARTAEAWLRNLDAEQVDLLPLLAERRGAIEARRWFARWRVFFMACAELFAYRHEQKWWVSHYLFRRRGG